MSLDRKLARRSDDKYRDRILVLLRLFRGSNEPREGGYAEGQSLSAVSSVRVQRGTTLQKPTFRFPQYLLRLSL